MVRALDRPASLGQGWLCRDCGMASVAKSTESPSFGIHRVVMLLTY